MFRVLDCITDQHDLRLVVLAALICAFACYTALGLLARACSSNRSKNLAWLSGAAIVFGSGVWATHFVAELAFKPGFAIGYDIFLTALSFVIAMVMSWVGLAIANLGRRPFLGGSVVGASIGTMHYVGMAALSLPADKFWDERYVIASLVIAVVFGGLGLKVAASGGTLRARVGGALWLIAAICGLHFTGMSAVILVPNPLKVVSSAVLDPEWMAVTIAAVTVMIIALGLFGAIADGRRAQRVEREAERLRRYITELETTKAELQATTKNLAKALGEVAAAGHAKVALERQLHHSQRLESLGTLAGGIAHELNNTLVPIVSLTKRALDKEPLQSTRRKELTLVYEASLRGRDLVKRILAFSRKDIGGRQAAQIEQIVADALEMLRPSIPASIAMVSELTKVPPVICDPGQVHQVLVNLVTNAAQAIVGRIGKISIRTSPMPRGEGAQIVIEDTGCGMSKETLERIFEPFFTTKEVGSGTGLGLAVVHGIVAAHGGTIVAESEPGKGTRFTLTFPSNGAVEKAAA